MLVITRREGEEVVIGDPANPIGVVRIASIKGDRVRIAFDFPRAIDVHRREVANQILAGGEAAEGAAATQPVAGQACCGGGCGHANGHANGHVNGHAAPPQAPATK
jgi:carbon storage regulator